MLREIAMLKSMMIAVLSICLVLGGCSSSRYVRVDNPLDSKAPAVLPGDQVRVTLKSGEIRRLKVATADRETITGDDLDSRHSGNSVQVAMADVQTLEVLASRDISAAKTTGLVVGIVAAVAAVLVAAFFISCYSENGQCSE